MIELLNAIVSFITTIIGLIISTFEALISFVVNIPQYINFINISLSMLPSFLLPYAVFGVSITVIAMLISREIL